MAKSSTRFVLSATLIGGLTLASRLLGLVRETIFSYYFSTGELLSAFRIAFQAPNLARRLFGEGALSSAMIPVLTESLETQGEAASKKFVGNLLTLLFVVLTGALLLIETVVLSWRMYADDKALRLTGIMMPYMVLICTSAVASGVLNVRRHFAVPAAAPTILNVAMIAALIGGAKLWHLDDAALMDWTCYSVLIAGVLQLLLTAFALRQVAFVPAFGWAWRDPQIRRVFVLMGPMALGLSAVQINTLVDSIIAYLFIVEDGQRVGPAVLGYAQFLYQLPLGVVGISLATAIFPELSSKVARNDRAGLAETVVRGLRMSLFLALPSAVGLIFVATPLVATLYQRGEFDAADTTRVAGTLFFYSLGLPAYFSQHIVIRTYYALKDSRTPAKAAACMVALDIAMNLCLVFVMQERGLALATAVCASLQVLYLLSKLRARVPELVWANLLHGLRGTLLATAVMTAVLAVLTVALPGLASNLLRLTILVTAGVGAYLVTAYLLRLEELRIAMHRST